MSAEDQCKNILVLGQSNTTICRFVKLFAIYVKSKGYEDIRQNFQKWVLRKKWKVITTPIDMKKDDKKLKLVPISLESFKAVLTNLQEFIKPQQVDAIIILLENDNEMFQLFKERYYPGLKKLPTLFVKFDNGSVNEDDTELLDFFNFKTLGEGKYLSEKNLFSFKAFCDMECNDDQHWTEAMDTCQNMFHYIINDTRKSCDVYFATEQNLKLLLNFIDKLVDVTMEIYFLSSYYDLSPEKDGKKILWHIEEYKKNITACGCGPWMKADYGFIMKPQKICHYSCRCDDTDPAKCKVFKNPEKKCVKCGHDKDSHYKLYYKKNFTKIATSLEESKNVALSALATFTLYKVEKGESCDLDRLLFSKLELKSNEHRTIYHTSKIEFKEELVKAQGKGTLRDVFNSINNLYSVNTDVIKIIPKFIHENFPKELQLNISETPITLVSLINDLKRKIKEIDEDVSELTNKVMKMEATTSNNINEVRNKEKKIEASTSKNVKEEK